jgi:hypothetical protein
MHRDFINNLVAELEPHVIFIRGKEVISQNRIDMKYQCDLNIELLMNDTLKRLNLEVRPRSFTDTMHTWMLFGQTAKTVWHIVVDDHLKVMTIQWFKPNH